MAVYEIETNVEQVTYPEELGIDLLLAMNNGGRDNAILNSDGTATREMLFNITPFTNKTIIAKVSGQNLMTQMKEVAKW